MTKYAKTKKVLAGILILCMAFAMGNIAFASGSDASWKTSGKHQVLTGLGGASKDELADYILDSFIQHSDTQVSDKIRNKIYNLFYVAQFRPDSLGGTENKSWPFQNYGTGYGTSVTDTGLGQTVSWGWGSAGCYSYACFGNAYTHDNSGNPTAYAHRLTGDVTGEQIKKLFNEYADPGEQIRYYHNKVENSSNNWHSLLYLCEDNAGNGFYALSYAGGRYSASGRADTIDVRYYTYDNFAAVCMPTHQSGVDLTVAIFGDFNIGNYWVDGVSGVAAGIPRDIVLVLDISGSMSGTKLSNTKIAASNFVDQIIDATSKTRIAVVSYDSYITKSIDFTREKESLKGVVNALRAGSSTNIYGALEMAGTMLDESSASKRAIVLMTDGEANVGVTGSAGTRIGHDGNNFNVTAYGASIFDLAETYKDTNKYDIYTLGFGLAANSREYNLLKNVCTMDKFFSVTSMNINDLQFAFEDIADNATKKMNAHLKIECPVEVAVSRNGETLDSSNPDAFSASFGNLTVSGAGDERCIEVDLEYNEDYTVTITGTGTGTMDSTFVLTQGDVVSTRTFKNVPITPNTIITTSVLHLELDTILYIDHNGDGEIEEGWFCGDNETVDKASTALKAIIDREPDGDIPLDDGNDVDDGDDVDEEKTCTDAIADFITVVYKILKKALQLSYKFLMWSLDLIDDQYGSLTV